MRAHYLSFGVLGFFSGIVIAQPPVGVESSKENVDPSVLSFGERRNMFTGGNSKGTHQANLAEAERTRRHHELKSIAQRVSSLIEQFNKGMASSPKEAREQETTQSIMESIRSKKTLGEEELLEIRGEASAVLAELKGKNKVVAVLTAMAIPDLSDAVRAFVLVALLTNETPERVQQVLSNISQSTSTDDSTALITKLISRIVGNPQIAPIVGAGDLIRASILAPETIADPEREQSQKTPTEQESEKSDKLGLVTEEALKVVEKLRSCEESRSWPVEGSDKSSEGTWNTAYFNGLIRPFLSDPKEHCLNEMIKINTGARALVYIFSRASILLDSPDALKSQLADFASYIFGSNIQSYGTEPERLLDAYRNIKEKKMLKKLLTSILTFPEVPVEHSLSFSFEDLFPDNASLLTSLLLDRSSIPQENRSSQEKAEEQAENIIKNLETIVQSQNAFEYA